MLVTVRNWIEMVKVLKWVTREYVHVDRTACPWLIRRFVDSHAKFIFIPPEIIEDVVKKEKAIPYDAPNVELGHHGDKCSFDAIIQKYGIDDDALTELAKIVRAADTQRPEMAAEAAGLSAIMAGVSTAAKDDFKAIEAAAPVYNALYAYCKVKILTDKYKHEIEKMNRQEKRKFLRTKIKESSLPHQ